MSDTEPELSADSAEAYTRMADAERAASRAFMAPDEPDEPAGVEG